MKLKNSINFVDFFGWLRLGIRPCSMMLLAFSFWLPIFDTFACFSFQEVNFKHEAKALSHGVKKSVIGGPGTVSCAVWVSRSSLKEGCCFTVKRVLVTPSALSVLCVPSLGRVYLSVCLNSSPSSNDTSFPPKHTKQKSLPV